jgi:hypothetical protein
MWFWKHEEAPLAHTNTHSHLPWGNYINTSHIYLGHLLFECLKFCKCRPYCRYVSCGKKANDFCSNTITKHIYISWNLLRTCPSIWQSTDTVCSITALLSSGHATILTGGWLKFSSTVKWGFIPFRIWPDIRIKFQVLKRYWNWRGSSQWYIKMYVRPVYAIPVLYSEDGGSRLLRNVPTYLWDFRTSHHRRS